MCNDIRVERAKTGKTVWTEAVDQRIAELHEAGMTYSRIAAKLGMTKNCIIGRVDRLRKRRAISKMPLPAMYLTVRDKRDQARMHGEVLTDLPIYELAAHECRWPTRTFEGVQLFCAHATMNGHPYCEKHHELAVIKRSAYERMAVITFKRLATIG
jgi:GcrA cell cycle regulator